MKQFVTAEGIGISYEDDYFGPPWLQSEAQAVVLVHGTAESSRAWYAWVPPLGAAYRVIRPDMPGFGQSRIAPEVPYSWSAERWASDLRQLVDHLGLKAIHLVGAKYGGAVSVQFASAYPDRVKTLNVMMGPMQVRGGQGAMDVQKFAERIDASIRKWVEETMGDRLGSSVSEAQRRWWIEMMAASDPRAARESAIETVRLELLDKLRQVRAPTLFVTTDGNKLVLLDTFREWLGSVPGIALEVLKSDSYHPAASNPAECIGAVLAHMARTSAKRA